MFEQERVIGRLQRRVLSEPTIIACFLSGSFGRQTADAYADLDLALIFAGSAARDHAWPRRAEFARSVMPYVPMKAFTAQHVRPYFYIALLANGSKIDFRYEASGELLPNPWDAQIRVLKDTDGWAEAYQAECARLSKPQAMVDRAEMVAIDQRFWVMFWDTLRLLARGDADKPFPIYLQMLAFTLPTLLHALPAEDAAHQALLNVTYRGEDTRLTGEALRQLMHAYVQARAAIVARYALQPAGDAAFEGEISRLIQKLS